MSTNLRAARAIALAATSPTEARMFMEMCGLLDDNGRIAPDESRRPIRPDTHKPVVRGSHFTDKPKQSTAPEALRVLAPIVPVKAVAAPKPKKVKSVAEGRKSRAKGGRQSTAECGTPGGYNRHRREGHKERCQPCLDAHNAASREWDAARKANLPKGPRKGRQPAPCGTTGGNRQHYKPGAPPVCAPCREADRLAAQKRRAAKRAA